MAEYPGFVGPSGQLAALTVDAERAVNVYPEAAPGSGKNRYWLRPTPGLSLFATLGTGPVRALFYQDGRAFAVSGDRFYELFSDGTATARGAVSTDYRPAQIHSSGAIGNQLFIVSGGSGYIFNLLTNALTLITSANFPASTLFGAYADSYFLALFNGTQKFAFSNLGNGLLWDPLDVFQKSQTTDNILTMIYDHKELWLLGSKFTEVLTNTGDARTPWTPRPVLIEGGISAQFSWAKGDDSIFWIRGNEQGSRRIVRADGYSAVEIGSQAVHTAINSYARIDDAIGWFYEDEGHGFYVLTFPSAEATWVFDVATNLWHERLLWDSDNGRYLGHLGRCHAFAFEGSSQRHLVGSRLDGKVYTMAPTIYTDNGKVIRRMRRAPHVIAQNRETFYDLFEVSIAEEPAAFTDTGYDPLTFMRYSDDGGSTWSDEVLTQKRAVGERERRLLFDQLGSSRNRVFEVVSMDANFRGFVNAYLETHVGAH